MKLKKYSKSMAWTQIVLIFILPILLLYFNILPDESRLFLLSLSSLILYGIIRREKWSYSDVGVRLSNFKKCFLPYLIFTLSGVFILFLLALILDINTDNTPKTILNRFIFFIPFSFLQEFAYRAFLIRKLKLVLRNNTKIILANSFLFMILHMIYPDSAIMLPVAFIGGLSFAYIYIKYPNLLLVSISHSILNITAVLLGFFIL